MHKVERAILFGRNLCDVGSSIGEGDRDVGIFYNILEAFFRLDLKISGRMAIIDVELKGKYERQFFSLDEGFFFRK